MGKAKYIVAGLLAGLGTSMVRAGQAKREAALAELDRQHDLMMEGMRHSNNLGEIEKRGEIDAASDDRQHKNRMGELEFGANRDDARTDKDNERDDKRSADERAARAGESAADRAWREKEAEKGRQFDANESAADRQAEFDNGLLDDDDDLVEIADPTSPSGTRMVRKKDAVGQPGKTGASDALERSREDDADAALAYEEQARNIVDSMAGYFSSDESDFGDGGREAAVNKVKKALERGDDTVVINGKTVDLGGTSGGGREADAPSQRPDNAQQPQAGVPKGAGTKDNPYQGVTQADIDWFKKSAPKGAVISANGKLYVK